MKSKSRNLGSIISDGAYDTMIERITCNNNPDFFFMSYTPDTLCVRDFMLIPKHFFVPDVIQQRAPLASTARRAGWIGCNILLDRIPEQGKIHIISDGKVNNAAEVISKVNQSRQLETDNMNSRSWLIDILNCINKLPAAEFTLDEVYAFEEALHAKHPQNNHIRPKIRQQLQFLRDKGFVEFSGSGHYRKLHIST